MNDLDGLRAALDGDLLTSASPGYDTARYPAMARYRDVRPQAFVRCASTQDVVRAIGYARDTGAQVVPRGGGHCFAGRYSTEGLVLDLGRLNAITVGPDGRARIRAGARLAQVYDALHNRRRTVPAGCGPTVGIAGLTLGGGLGLLGRTHGLTCDALAGRGSSWPTGASSTATPTASRSCCGRGAGGGQFGVVTSLAFATVPEPCATGGARTHDRRIMRSTTPCIVSASCTDTTEPCRRWP